MDERLYQIANFKVRPGAKNYHYAALATVDENGHPYVRLRSPTVQRKVADLRKDLEAMLASGRSRLKPEEIKAIMELDEKNQEHIDSREELIMLMEEFGNPDHVKRTLKNLERHNQGVLVTFETEIVMVNGRPCNARVYNGNDAIFEVRLEEVCKAGHPYYEYRKARYMIQLASFHLASFAPEDREKRFNESIRSIFTLRTVGIDNFIHRFKHAARIPADLRLDNPEIAATFVNDNPCGAVASIDHKTGNVTAIPCEAFAIYDLGPGVFIEIDTTQKLGKEMYERIIDNATNNNDPYISFSNPAVGMGAEIGLAYDGKVRLDEQLLKKAREIHPPHEGTEIVYLDPQRITDVSTPQDRRGRIIYSHFKEIGWKLS